LDVGGNYEFAGLIFGRGGFRLGAQATFTHRMITDDQRKHYLSASLYVLSRRDKCDKGVEKTYPLCRGDLLILVMLIDQDLAAASPSADPKRLAAIRGKLGDLVFEAPEMSKEEAQQFR
jgi:hypothetical protein